MNKRQAIAHVMTLPVIEKLELITKLTEAVRSQVMEEGDTGLFKKIKDSQLGELKSDSTNEAISKFVRIASDSVSKHFTNPRILNKCIAMKINTIGQLAEWASEFSIQPGVGTTSTGVVVNTLLLLGIDVRKVSVRERPFYEYKHLLPIGKVRVNGIAIDISNKKNEIKPSLVSMLG